MAKSTMCPDYSSERYRILVRGAVLLAVLVTTDAVVGAQATFPRKPAGATSAGKSSEKEKLASILNRQKDAFLACGDPETVPGPKIEPNDGLIQQANKHAGYIEETNKIYACQRSIFDTALPDLKKTGASDEAIGAAMQEWQNAMHGKLKELRDKALASPSPGSQKP